MACRTLFGKENLLLTISGRSRVDHKWCRTHREKVQNSKIRKEAISPLGFLIIASFLRWKIHRLR